MPTAPAPAENKPGYKTTEFWLTAFTSAATLANQSGLLGTPIPVEALTGLVGMVVAYTGGRSFAKR